MLKFIRPESFPAQFSILFYHACCNIIFVVFTVTGTDRSSMLSAVEEGEYDTDSSQPSTALMMSSTPAWVKEVSHLRLGRYWILAAISIPILVRRLLIRFQCF